MDLLEINLSLRKTCHCFSGKLKRFSNTVH